MPCDVTATLIELLADDSIKISGTGTGDQLILITIVDLTITKQATRSGSNWSVTYSGTDITGDLTQFRAAFCGGQAQYQVDRPPSGTHEFPCSGTAGVAVQCGQCPTVTGSFTVHDCDADGNHPVDLVLDFSPPIPQGDSAQVIWAFGGPDAQGQTSAVDTLPTANGPVAQQLRTVVLPPRPATGSPNACSYVITAGITVVIGGQICPIVPVDMCVVVDACLPCPGTATLPPVTLTIETPAAWCAPPQPGQQAKFTATVNWPPGTPGPPVPSQFDWSVTTPDGTIFQRETDVGSTTTADDWLINNTGAPRTVDLSQAGTYAVSATAKFPPDAGLPTLPDGTSSCNITNGSSFKLDACEGPATCPSITSLDVTPDCADPAAGHSATVGFTVSTTDPSGLITGFTWDFGDPASGGANQATTATPNATHSYAGTGDFTVSVQANVGAGCQGGGPTTATTLVSVGLCPCPPGQVRDANNRCVAAPPPDGEDTGCFLVRQLIAALAALAFLTAALAVCFFSAPPAFWIVIGIAAGLAAAALIILIVWLLLPCPRPCAWWLLMLGQIFFGFGWGAVYFSFCCAWLGWIGLGALALGLGLLYAWYNECRPTLCKVAHELAWVLTAVVGPVVAFILLYPPANACAFGDPISKAIIAFLTVIDAGIVLYALSCDPAE